jgi:tetratricopeptide (TPR) repeat protein
MRFIVREMRSIAYSLRHHDSHSSPRTNFSGTSAASENSEGIFDSYIAQLQKKDVDGAITDLSRAIDLNPRYVEAFFIRGQCLFLKRDLDKALSDYDKVIALAPWAGGVERVYNTRSVIQVLKGDLEKAFKDVEQAIALNPNYADAYSNRGLIRSFRNDQAGAASDYEKSIALDSKSPATYINRGILFFESGNLARAATDFNRAVELAPNTAKPYVDLGVLHTLNGEVDLAVTHLKKAYSLDPTSFVETSSGLMSSPFKRLQSFITSNPANARAYEARGLLRLAQGRKAEAKEDFAKSVELNPGLRSETERLLNITF